MANSKKVKKPMAIKNGGSKPTGMKSLRPLSGMERKMAGNMVKKSGMPGKKGKRGK